MTPASAFTRICVAALLAAPAAVIALQTRPPDSAPATGESALTLWYRQPANDWNEALPVGNGRLGGHGLRRRVEVDQELFTTKDTKGTKEAFEEPLNAVPSS